VWTLPGYYIESPVFLPRYGPMALRLTIISEQSSALGEAASKLVDKEGARIGRASDNEWVLPDPNRYISAHHARIFFRNGTYIVEDTSTNGLYLNDELEPVGRLGPQPLRAGDTLRMGPYHIRVRDSDSTVADASAITPYGIENAGEGPDHPQRDIGVDLNINALLVEDVEASAARRGYDTWGNPVADPGLVQFDTEQQAAATAPRPAPPRPVTTATKSSPNAPGILEAFCRGAGVGSPKLPAESQERLLQLAGLLLRESLVGIKALARLQREIRQESGLSAIAEDSERLALQNLPVEELLVRLLLGHEQRQLDAVQWMRELYGLASRHDAALMRALRPALIEFTQRLDPTSLSPGSAGAERFRSITDMPEGRLPHLFAESLARSFKAEIGGGSGDN
jgi:predicted component of type VI protein secretion system